MAEDTSQLERTEAGRKILRFRQTARRAKAVGWLAIAIAFYQFFLAPFIAWLDPHYNEFIKATGASHVAIFVAVVGWHCALLGIDGIKSVTPKK